jgi:hypothetical protein
MAGMTRRTLREPHALLLAACAGVFVGCGGAATAPDVTDQPTNIILTGAWAGTLVRAQGLTPIGVSWIGKPSSSFAITDLTFSGPVTLSRDADRLAGALSVALRGTSASPTLSLALAVDPGDAASTLPSCAIVASAPRSTSVTSTSLVATVSMTFSGCPSLVNGLASASETAVLRLDRLYVR